MTTPVVTLVTGGGSGIGAALCRRIAGPSRAVLVHTGSNRANAEAVAATVQAAGGRAAVAVQDLGQPEAGAGLVADAVARFGRLDQVVHVAGRADRRAFGDLDEAGLDAAMTVNARAFLSLANAALPYLREAGRDLGQGRIVATGSFLSAVFRLGPGLGFPATAASKAALVALVRSLAAQVAADGITANCVVPGFIQKAPGQHTALTEDTRRQALGLIPMGRMGQPEEAAAAIAFLLSPDASYITGQCLHVDGGITL